MPRIFLLSLLTFATPVTAEIVTTTFGQGYSQREGEIGLDVEPYEGSGPAIGASLGLRVNRLEIEPVKIEIAMGETFSLRQLTVRAYGRNNVFVEAAPLTIALEAPDDLVDLDPFREDGHTLLADQPGIGRIWINSIAPAARGDNFNLPVVLVVTGQRAIPQPPFLF